MISKGHNHQRNSSLANSPPIDTMMSFATSGSSVGSVAAAARALYSSTTSAANSLAHSSAASWLSAANHPANLSQKSAHSTHNSGQSNRTGSNSSNGPYDPFLTTPYGNFASPLSRLSLFSGMAGMHSSAALGLGHMMNGAAAAAAAANGLVGSNNGSIHLDESRSGNSRENRDSRKNSNHHSDNGHNQSASSGSIASAPLSLTSNNRKW